MASPRILLIVGGGIAAYNACELIRLIRKDGMSVRCVLTEGGAHFVTPMTLAALSENKEQQKDILQLQKHSASQNWRLMEMEWDTYGK